MIGQAVPTNQGIHLLLDNHSTLKTAMIRQWPGSPSPTPLAFRTERQVRRGAHRSTGQLEKAIMNCSDTCNEGPKPFQWTKAAGQVLALLKPYCKAINDAGH